MEPQSTNRDWDHNFLSRLCDRFPSSIWRVLSQAGPGPEHMYVKTRTCFGAAYLSLFIGTLITSIFLFCDLLPIEKAHGTQAWAPVNAKIVSSRKADYRAIVHYTYDVGGKTFESDQISILDPQYRDASIPDKLLNKYPAGSNSIAYYNPAKPSESVLLRGFRVLDVGDSFKYPLALTLLSTLFLVLLGYVFALSAIYVVHVATFIGIIGVVAVLEFTFFGIDWIKSVIGEHLPGLPAQVLHQNPG